MDKINIAIDGYTGCGKSTTAKLVAEKLNYLYVDTGAMYRAVTAYILRNNIPLEEITEELFKDFKLEYSYDNATKTAKIHINGEDYTPYLRLPEISKNVSAVSAIPAVRNYLVPLQREMSKQKGIIIDGRDIGSVVMPDAELKVFMTADLDVRARRRYEELKERGIKTSLEEVKKMIAERDKKDTTRKIGPLVRVPDAQLLDTSDMTIEEQVNQVIEWTNQVLNERKSHSC